MYSSERRMSYTPRMTWGWINLGLIFLFGWTIPLKTYIILMKIPEIAWWTQIYYRYHVFVFSFISICMLLYPYWHFLKRHKWITSMNLTCGLSARGMNQCVLGFQYEWNRIDMRVFSAPYRYHLPILGKNRKIILKYFVT